MNRGTFSWSALMILLFLAALTGTMLTLARSESALAVREVERIRAEQEILTVVLELRQVLGNDPTPLSHWGGDPFWSVCPDGAGESMGYRFSVTQYGGRLTLRTVSGVLLRLPGFCQVYRCGRPEPFLSARETVPLDTVNGVFEPYLVNPLAEKWFSDTGILSVNTTEPELVLSVLERQDSPEARQALRLCRTGFETGLPVIPSDWPSGFNPAISPRPPLNIHWTDPELISVLVDGLLEEPGDTAAILLRESRNRELSPAGLAALVPEDPGRGRLLSVLGTFSAVWEITVEKQGLRYRALILHPGNNLLSGVFL
jgi:hypothetical protein